MRVFEIGLDDDAAEAGLTVGYDQIRRLKRGIPGPVSNWQTETLEYSDRTYSKNTPLCDLTRCDAGSQFPIVTPRVERVLREHLGIAEQWLTVDLPGHEYKLLNLTHVVDALDTRQSEMTYFKDGGLKQVKVHVFKPSAIKNEWLFRDKTRPRILMCTQQFTDLVAQEGWMGFEFKPIWDSEHAPFPSWPSKAQVVERPDVFGPEGFVVGYQESWPESWKVDEKANK